MPDHLKFSDHMTAREAHEPIARTFLGQAHLAGTGPDGATCRQCIFWHIRKRVDGQDKLIPAPPGYRSHRNPVDPLGLKKAHCARPILNKAKRLVPHHAGACRLFEPNECPPPVRKLGDA